MPRPAEDRRRALRKGYWSEYVAAALLLAKGYRILALRYAGGGGEIDLIAKRGRVVAFVEVKARGNRETALGSIGPQKLRRMARAVRYWTVRNPWCQTHTLRGDAVVVLPGRLPQHVPDAFPLEA